MKNEIIVFENGEIKLEVNVGDETVWLTQKQMAELFHKDQNTINEHINNIFDEGELDEITSTGISGKSTGGRKPKIYNLDVIISVGYRVKSQNGVLFRKWATNVLKDHLLKGYTVNQKRLEYLEKTVKLIDIAGRMDDAINGDEAKEIIKVINNYSNALNMLDDYDHKRITKPKGTKCNNIITYEDCKNIINDLKFNNDSDLFALERNEGLKSILNNIYSSFDGSDLYPSTEEKVANLLYLTVKNHVFIDGNKRIAATLFIYALKQYNLLFVDNKQRIDNNTLVALTLLIAQSNPKEKDILIDLVMNFLVEN